MIHTVGCREGSLSKFLRIFFFLLNKNNVDKEFREIITEIFSMLLVEKYCKAPY